MAYLGLVPSLYNSGEKRKTGRITKRRITKTGNGHVRRALIEAAQAYRLPARKSRAITKRNEDLPPVAQQTYGKFPKSPGRLTTYNYHIIIRQIDKEKNMAHCKNNSMEKVTFNMPTELKKKVMALQEDLQVSLSAIFNEAIANYLTHKEIEMWQRGVSMALEDEAYMKQAKELGSDTGDFIRKNNIFYHEGHEGTEAKPS